MAKKEKMIYEIGYNLIPTMSPEDVAKEVGMIKEKITSLGGEIISDEYPNLIKLAYEMLKEIDNKNVKFTSAFFGWVKFEIEPEHVAAINKMAESSENVLRFIIIKTVRENTMYTPKVSKNGKRYMSDGVSSFDSSDSDSDSTEEESAEPMDEEEVDAKIDELLEEDTDL